MKYIYLSRIINLIQLRFTFENQPVISSSIQNFGRLIDMSREQQQQQSTTQVIQIQQPRFTSPGHPQSATTHYVATIPHPIYNQEQNNQCKFVLNKNE